MKTFALLFLGLAVVLGLPLEQRETLLAAPEADQRPLVGDLLPAQGHVVVEQPAPHPEPSKPQQQPAPHPDAKPQMIEIVEVKQDSHKENEIGPEESKSDVEALVGLQHEAGLLGYFEPNADIVENLVEDEDQKLHEETPDEEKDEYKETEVKLELIINEEMQSAESAGTNSMDDEVYGEPPVKEVDSEELEKHQDETGLIDYSEPNADIVGTLLEDKDFKLNEETPEEETDEYEESIMKPELMINEEMQKNAEFAGINHMDNGVYEIADSEDPEPHQAEAGLMAYSEPNADIVEDLVEDKDQKLNEETPEEETDEYEETIMKLEPISNEEVQDDEAAGINHDVYEEPEMHLEPESDGYQGLRVEEEAQAGAMEEEGPMLDALGQPLSIDGEFMRLEPEEQTETSMEQEAHGTSFMDNGVYEEPEMHLEPESDGYQAMNEGYMPQALAMEEEGPMLDALGQPLSIHGEFMGLEPEEQTETSMEKEAHGTNFMNNGVFEEEGYMPQALAMEEEGPMLDALGQPLSIHGEFMGLEPEEQTETSMEKEAHGTNFMNNGVFEEEGYMPQALAMEEEGPMLDALGQPLSIHGEFMGLEPEEQTETSMKKEAHEGRYCPGMVLEGQCFQFFTNAKKASAAEFFCQTFPGGHLAAITSAHVHSQMMALMRQSGGTRRTWVGGLRLLDSNQFLWLDGSPWNYADWLRGEPNNTSGLENCIELLASGKFNDFTCWEPQAFICSYPYQ